MYASLSLLRRVPAIFALRSHTLQEQSKRFVGNISKKFQIPKTVDKETRPHFLITREIASQMAEAFSKFTYDPMGSEEFITRARCEAYKTIPPQIIHELSRLRSTDSGSPYLIIDNLPIDNGISGSPKSGEHGSKYKAGTLTENLLTGFSGIFGEPYGIAYETNGALISNLVPQKEATQKYTGEGSRAELTWHNENAMQAYYKTGDISPTELLLLGLREEPNTQGPYTRVADCRKALKLLSSEEIKTLRSPCFELKPPYRWRSDSPTAEGTKSIHAPIISGPEHAPRVTAAFYPDMVKPLNPNAALALEAFRSAIDKVGIAVRIHPGRLLVINNRFSVHARDGFEAKFDENGNAYRWVQRIFTRPSLWNFRDFRRISDRIFLPPQPYQSTKIASISPQTTRKELTPSVPKPLRKRQENEAETKSENRKTAADPKKPSLGR